MTPACISDLDLSAYRELLDTLLSDDYEYALSDPAGNRLWGDADFPSGVIGAVLSSPGAGVIWSQTKTPMRFLLGTAARAVFAAPILDDTPEEKLAILWAASKQPCDATAERLKWLSTIAALIAKELRLTTELDLMATELSERYEELNLVYHTEDQVNYLGEGWAALKQLVRNCCDYLEVGMAILAVQERGIVISQQSCKCPVPEATALTNFVHETVSPILIDAGESLIVDDLREIEATDGWQGPGLRLLAVPIFDGRNAPIGLIAIVTDGSNRSFSNSDKNLLQVMARKANKILQVSYDNLTGLVNRQGLSFIANELLQDARALEISHTVLHVDIDQLHVINDTQSREAGDALIEAVATHLRRSTRETDVVCRVGGDEMVVLLKRCPLARGAELAEKLRQSISDLVVPWDSHILTATVTVGVAPIESGTTSAQAALAAAELACDAAKELGNNRVHLFQHEDARLIQRHQEMETVGRIQSAVRENRMELLGQIIAPLSAEEEGLHFETLIRMQGPDGETILPGLFIPAAERYHLMPEIDRWVISHLFERLSRDSVQLAETLSMVSINLSGQTLNEPGFGDWLTDKLNRFDFPLDLICFEITETAAVASLEEARAFMRTVKKFGCKFALDDFGSGLSSFGYLRSLPIDYLKIDGCLVKEIADDPVVASMVAAVQQVASVMRLETIAEFVETEAIIQKLREIGVDYIQGYAVGRPQPLSEHLSTKSPASEALTA